MIFRLYIYFFILIKDLIKVSKNFTSGMLKISQRRKRRSKGINVKTRLKIEKENTNFFSYSLKEQNPFCIRVLNIIHITFRRASSWSIIPAEVVNTMKPNWREGKRLLTHFSISTILMLKRGEMTPHLFNLPLSWITILPERWSSMISNSPM